MKAVLRALAGVAGAASCSRSSRTARRLTAMPAWGTGTPDGERASWALVHFIRRLPTLTAEEIGRMEELNPKTPDQFREDEEIRRFLAAAGAPPATQALPAHERSHQ